jgi:hypothetical protein
VRKIQSQSEKHRNYSSFRIISRVYQDIFFSSLLVSRPLPIKRFTFLPLPASTTVSCVQNLISPVLFRGFRSKACIGSLFYVSAMTAVSTMRTGLALFVTVVCISCLHCYIPLTPISSQGRDPQSRSRSIPKSEQRLEYENSVGRHSTIASPCFTVWGRFFILFDIFSPVLLSLIACIDLSLDVRCRSV